MVARNGRLHRKHSEVAGVRRLFVSHQSILDFRRSNLLGFDCRLGAERPARLDSWDYTVPGRGRIGSSRFRTLAVFQLGVFGES